MNEETGFRLEEGGPPTAPPTDGAETATAETALPSPPLPRLRRVLLVLAAASFAGVAGATFGLRPWEAWTAPGTRSGWTAERSLLVILGIGVAGSLVAAFLPAGRARALLALGVAGLASGAAGGTLFPAAPVVGAVAAAGAISASLPGRRFAATVLLLAGLLAWAGLFALPRAPSGGDPVAQAEGPSVLQALRDDVLAARDGRGRPLAEVLFDPANLALEVQAALAVVAILALLGLGGGWAAAGAGLLVLLWVLVPPLRAASLAGEADAMDLAAAHLRPTLPLFVVGIVDLVASGLPTRRSRGRIVQTLGDAPGP